MFLNIWVDVVPTPSTICGFSQCLIGCVIKQGSKRPLRLKIILDRCCRLSKIRTYLWNSLLTIKCMFSYLIHLTPAGRRFDNFSWKTWLSRFRQQYTIFSTVCCAATILHWQWLKTIGKTRHSYFGNFEINPNHFVRKRLNWIYWIFYIFIIEYKRFQCQKSGMSQIIDGY